MPPKQPGPSQQPTPPNQPGAQQSTKHHLFKLDILKDITYSFDKVTHANLSEVLRGTKENWQV